MRGLLQKDFYMLSEMKKMILVILAIAFLLLIANSGSESFVVSYLIFVAAFLTLATITQDEHSKGVQFLMTLPVSRKNHVQEKYLLGIVMGGGAWILAAAAALAVTSLRGKSINEEFLAQCVIYLPILLLMLGLMLPIQFRFGGDKGRIAIMAAVAGGMLACFLVLKIVDLSNLTGAKNFFENYYRLIFVVATLILLAGFWISYRISLAIMNKKEF